MKEEGEYRNDWPMGRVTDAIKSQDGRVRKVSVAIIRDGKKKVMLRPIKELILLVPTGADKRPATKDHKEGVARM
jgi:hypothetical protein